MPKKKKMLEEEEVEETRKKFAEHLADKTGMPAESIEEGVDIFIRRSAESLPEQYSPPYGSVVWYERFLEIAQTRRLDIVDREFISMNIIGSKNEYKVLRGLRFLGLVDENYNGTEKLHSLRLVGKAFQNNLSTIVHDAYRALFSTVVIKRAKPETIINFLMQRYAYSERTAREATKIFVMLCEKAGIELPTQLEKMPSRAVTARTRVRRKPEIVRKREKPATRRGPPLGSIELKLDNIVIWIPKNDLNAAFKAKRLLDLYIEGLEDSG